LSLSLSSLSNHPVMSQSTLFLVFIIGMSVAAGIEQNRAKRQFVEVESVGGYVPHYQPSAVYRYGGATRWAAAADPYFSGIPVSAPYYAPRQFVYTPVVQRRPIYQRMETVDYVPVKSVYRARPIVYERPVTTVIERPAQFVSAFAPRQHVIELEKKRRMMAKH
ncbi:hypothetical protein PFISCL1PPCAC_28289, partial [Pristionchus fissidentatus]